MNNVYSQQQQYHTIKGAKVFFGHITHIQSTQEWQVIHLFK